MIVTLLAMPRWLWILLLILFVLVVVLPYPEETGAWIGNAFQSIATFFQSLFYSVDSL
jgi:hypothetical protein